MKQKVTVRVAGRDYTLVSEDPPEYLQRVASYVDRKLTENAAAARVPVSNAAILTTIDLGDELMRAKDENQRLRRQLNDAMEKLNILRGQ